MNQRKHGLSFETAQLAFEDPFALSQLDIDSGEEERWQTVGAAGGMVVLFVVHTWPSADATGEEVGRIISARKATRLERRAYEEGAF